MSALFTDEEKAIINTLENKIKEDEFYLDFRGANTKEFSHVYHSYPAMMIPQLARELIKITTDQNHRITNVIDPFMGSGTTLVEGLIKDLSVYGNDINPLSEMVSKAKTHPIDPLYIEGEFNLLKQHILEMYEIYKVGDYQISNYPNFDRIDFWFKKEIIEKLQLIKNAILEYSNIHIKNFFMVAFSETVRLVSNTRNGEFKLYRMPVEKLEAWDPDVLEIYFDIVQRNLKGNKDLWDILKDKKTKVSITKGSSFQLPYSDESMDLLVTSPPYGDSKTTVAYGQYSRLSAQWLDLEIEKGIKINQLDNVMLGGKISKDLEANVVLEELRSETLSNVYHKIFIQDNKRAYEVLQFYSDLDKTLSEIERLMRKGSYQYWVVANRTVKKINIPTDQIIIELFEKYNIKYLHRFYRNIPNKRMPAQNSPTNKIGEKVTTMNREIIIMFKK